MCVHGVGEEGQREAGERGRGGRKTALAHNGGECVASVLKNMTRAHSKTVAPYTISIQRLKRLNKARHKMAFPDELSGILRVSRHDSYPLFAVPFHNRNMSCIPLSPYQLRWGKRWGVHLWDQVWMPGLIGWNGALAPRLERIWCLMGWVVQIDQSRNSAP